MKYGGYTRKELRKLVKGSDGGAGLESLLEDGDLVCDIIKDLLNHIKELKANKNEVPSKSESKKTSKAKKSKKPNVRKKGKVLHFPFG